jgi:hypothetical protein
MSDYAPERPRIPRLIYRRSVFASASPSMEPEAVWPQTGMSGTPHQTYPSLRPINDAIARRAPNGRPRPSSRSRRRSGENPRLSRYTFCPLRALPKSRRAYRGRIWRRADSTPFPANCSRPVGTPDVDMLHAEKWSRWSGVWMRSIFDLQRNVLTPIDSDDWPSGERACGCRIILPQHATRSLRLGCSANVRKGRLWYLSSQWGFAGSSRRASIA